jgi:hypothetical protein
MRGEGGTMRKKGKDDEGLMMKGRGRMRMRMREITAQETSMSSLGL